MVAKSKIHQAVLLSAGLGTRLRPLTDNIPKAMVPIGGRPILEWHIEQFKKHGVEEFFINLFYLPDVITNYFGDGSKFGVKINYAIENPKILGTAGGVKNFDGMLRDNFFMIYADIFSLVDYSKMEVGFNTLQDAIGVELIGDTDYPQDSDLVEVDRNLRFLKIYPKPHKEGLPSRYKSMRGVFILNEKILRYIPKGVEYNFDHELLRDILSRGEKFYGYETCDYLKDIGTMDRYKTVEEYLSRNKKIKNP